MTNLEKIRTGTDEEIKIILTRLAYRSLSYAIQERQVEEFLNQEAVLTYEDER